MTFARGSAIFQGFDVVETESRLDTTLAGRRFAGSENRMNARQIDFSAPADLGSKWTLVRAESGSLRMLAHLYTPGPYLLLNFFPGDDIAAASRCGAHILLVADGSRISSVERTTKKKMFGSGLKHSAATFTVERADGQGRLRFVLDAIGDDEEVSNAILACANAGHGQSQSWPAAAGQHKLTFGA